MKTLILGYPDSNRLGSPVVVAGFDVSVNDQAKIISDARELHSFPKDIKAVEQYAFDRPIAIAAFISDEVASFSKAVWKQQVKEKAIAKAQEVADTGREQAKRDANKAVTAAANKRNAAISAKAVPENALKGQYCAEKDKPGLLAQIDKLTPPLLQASLEFEAVLAASNVIKNPKSTNEEITAAQAVIADPAKAVASKQTTTNQ